MKLGGVFVTLVVVFSLLACGDDEDEPLSKSDFVRRGNAVCAKSQRDFQKLLETGFPTTRSAIPAFFERALPIFRERQRDLRALDPPDADKDRVDSLLASGDRAIADFDRATQDARLGARLFAQEGGRNLREFEGKAKRYGLAKCAEEEEEEDGEERKLDPSTFPPEKRAFVRRADAICRASNERNSALEQRYLEPFPPPLKNWAEFLPRIVRNARADTEQFEQLTPPAADKARLDRLIARQRELLPKLERAGRAAAAGDERAFQSLSREAFAEGDELDADLRRYGFQVCGTEEEGE